MPFSIIASDTGVVRLAVEGTLDDATVYVLRLELASLLRRPVRPVELSMARPDLLGSGGRLLLLSFYELLQAHGGVFTVNSRGVHLGPVMDLPQLERILSRHAAESRRASG